MSYKETLEEFVSNHNGTSLSEIYIIVSISPLLTFYVTLFVSFLFAHLETTSTKLKIWSFVIEFAGLIFPIVLCVTVVAGHHHIFAFTLLALFVLCSTIIINKTPVGLLKDLNDIKTDYRAFISYFRSIIGVYTGICILAVDFKIFPRRFAKTETYGYSLMDTGVGFYIIANSLVLKQQPKTPGLIKCIVSCIPLVCLGLIRLISIETLDYQKHVSEYGVHWNFFFTLAFVKLCSPFLVNMSTQALILTFLLLCSCHQLCLEKLGLEDWVLNDDLRSDLLSANKEGIVSLPGYVCLFIFGLILGRQVRNKVNVKSDVKNVVKLFMWYIITLISTLVLEFWFHNSRRLANSTYIVWMMSICLLVISLSIIVEVCLSLQYVRLGVKNFHQYLVPSVLESINYNALFYFLLTNLLTGFVNLMYHTVNQGPIMSLVIITVYILISCLIMMVLKEKKIKIKFW